LQDAEAARAPGGLSAGAVAKPPTKSKVNKIDVAAIRAARLTFHHKNFQICRGTAHSPA
jgi:hypothetical protein